MCSKGQIAVALNSIDLSPPGTLTGEDPRFFPEVPITNPPPGEKPWIWTHPSVLTKSHPPMGVKAGPRHSWASFRFLMTNPLKKLAVLVFDFLMVIASIEIKPPIEL
jgi:hypothetical protein